MTRFTYLLAVAAALVLALGTATAAAGTRPDDRETHGPGAVAIGVSRDITRPDDRAWRGIGPAPTLEIVESPAVSLDRFDWADAGIGALATLGAVLVVGGAAIVGLRRRPQLA